MEALPRQLGRMPKTVHTQLYRAKKMLRRELRGGLSAYGRRRFFLSVRVLCYIK